MKIVDQSYMIKFCYYYYYSSFDLSPIDVDILYDQNKNILSKLPQSIFLIKLFELNSIILAIPASILQPPFFDPYLPININYGALGFMISRKIISKLKDHFILVNETFLSKQLGSNKIVWLVFIYLC